MKNKPLTAILIGAGQRGKDALGSYALSHDNDLRFVAVAEPMIGRKTEFKTKHDIPNELCFNSWEELLEKEKLADIALICTLDNNHYEPTKLALEKGYHVLLEKPMSNNIIECIKLGELSKKYPKQAFSICHVLRFTKFFSELKKLVDSKVIGDIMTIQHNEYVGRIHQAHSFVRGNWGNSKKESPMILQKCCHDMDILFWLVGSKCKNISSFGSLDYYCGKYSKDSLPKRCLDGCPIADECAFNVSKIYLTDNIDWPTSVISDDLSYEGRRQALQTGPYGRCIYHCDNDVVDHQVISMQFENNVTVAMTMTAFCDDGRKIKIMGTNGEINASLYDNEIQIVKFPSKDVHTIKLSTDKNGHYGGDTGLMKDFINLVRNNGDIRGLTDATLSVHSHIMCFAAEEARVTNQVINIEDYINKHRDY
ncbi:Gfo/Idh/MocA family oxidoreductase [Clostridiaceae bacterium M8S5]|nr:Gfo/Idh/MocA family oxidoreductase [Clostridiaceae bacterium M8S5]